MKPSRTTLNAQPKPRFAAFSLASKALKVSKAKGLQARLSPSSW
jgi:hypothetical protein